MRNNRTFNNRNRKYGYSLITAWFGFAFSIYGVLNIYIYTSYVWIAPSVILPVILIILIKGSTSIYKLFYESKLPDNYSRLVMVLSGLTYFICSTYGLICLLNILPINDKSFLLLPLISILLVFGGSAIGLTKGIGKN